MQAVIANPAEALARWMREEIALLLEVAVERVPLDLPFDRFGLDSVAVVKLTASLAEHLGRDLDPVLFYEHPTIRELSEVLTNG